MRDISLIEALPLNQPAVRLHPALTGKRGYTALFSSGIVVPWAGCPLLAREKTGAHRENLA